MAFKMKGNPFPKKGGAFKQDIEQEYDAESLLKFGELSEKTDSLNNIANDLRLNAEKAQELYNQGDLSPNEFNKKVNLYNDFIKNYDIEVGQLQEDYDTHMQEFGDSLQKAQQKDIDIYENILNQYKAGDISENQYKKAFQDLITKRPNLRSKE